MGFKNPKAMTNDKKTIRLPNGEAEEGDRVKRIYGQKGVLKGVFRDSERTMIIVHIDGDPFPTEIQSFSDWIIDFGPTDALEAVEEERKEWQNSFYKHAVDHALDGLIDRINQKRKSHD